MRFLRKLREDRGLTHYGMAKLLGMLTNTYSHYENKAEGIRLETLSKLRKTLRLSWSELGRMIDEEVKENQRAVKK